MVGGYFLFIVRLVILMALGLLTKSENCSQLSYCSYTNENGHIFDLHRFQGKRFNISFYIDTYIWVPCQEFQCSSINQTICKFTPISSAINVPTNLGSLNSSQFTSSDGKVAVTYHDPSGSQISSISLLCAEKIEAEFTFLEGSTTRNSIYNHFQFRSKQFCFDNHSLSIGTAICIVFLCVVVLYLVLGLVINKFVRHLSGCEIIPNITFWKGCAGHIQDGFLFTAGRCGNINKKRDYSEI